MDSQKEITTDSVLNNDLQEADMFDILSLTENLMEINKEAYEELAK